MANVLHLFRALQRRLPMEEVAEVRALEDSGLEGCGHARTGSPRQVLLIDSETLELMELSPGIIRENITTRGINVNGLETGQRLQVGAAQLEVSMVCTPCDLLEKIRPGLRRELRGRRGMLCRITAGGVIRTATASNEFPSGSGEWASCARTVRR